MPTPEKIPLKTSAQIKAENLIKIVEQFRAKLVEKKYRDKAERNRKAMWALLDSPAGRLILYNLMDELGLYGDVCDTNALEMMKRAAKQEAAHLIQRWIYRVNPKAFHLMEVEHQTRTQEENQEIEIEVAKFKKENYHGK